MNSRRRLAIALFAVFVLGEVLLFAFNPFSGAGELRGISLSDFGLATAAKLWAIIFVSPFLALLLLGRFSSLKEKWFSEKAAWIAAGAYFVVFAALSFLRFLSFNSAPPDLWIFNQAMWSTVHGGFMEISRGAVTNYFAEHFAVFLLALAPIYAVFQSPLTLLLIQTAFVALGAIPVYWIAMRHLKQGQAAFAFAVSYLLFPALEFINLREFHSVALAIPLVLLAWNYFEKGKTKRFAGFFALSLLVEETIAPTMFFFGLYAFLKGKRKAGMVMCAASLAWFLFAVLAAITFFRHAPYAYLSGGTNLFAGLFSNPFGTIASVAYSAPKLGYLAMLAAPLLLLSLLGLPVLLIALPAFAQNLLSGYPAMASIYFQYNSTIIPFIFISAILGVERLAKISLARLRIPIAKSLVGISLAVILAALLSNAFLSPSPLSILDPMPTQANFSLQKYSLSAHAAVAWKAVGMIPQGAAVSADSFFLSQVSGRKSVGYFPETLSRADYVLLDASRKENPSASAAQKEFLELQSDSNFVRVFAEDGVFLFKRVE